MSASGSPLYFDYNATTPVADEVAEAMLPYLYERFGNPSSGHPYGRVARRAVEAARTQVAALLSCQPEEVIFTSGGTESNNQALKGAVLRQVPRGGRRQGARIISSTVEHPSILEVGTWLQAQGLEVTLLPVDEYGRVDAAELERIIGPDTLLVSIMHANNEVGTVQPIAELAQIARRHGVLMHTDAAQSLGKIPVNVGDLAAGKGLGVDMLSVAGHKLYAPKGIGALYVRRGVELSPLIHGAGQEGGRRPGTENVLEIVGLGKACEIAQRDLEKNMAHFLAMRDRLHQGLLRQLGTEAVRLNGHPQERLPNTLSLSFRGVEANRLLAEIGDQVAASAGAACHAAGVDVSAVLSAMNVPVEWAMGTIRFSVGRGTVAEDVDRAVQIVAATAGRLQAHVTARGKEYDSR
jgi:cysteine desulfurase